MREVPDWWWRLPSNRGAGLKILVKGPLEEAMKSRARILLVVSGLVVGGGMYVGLRVGGSCVATSARENPAAEAGVVFASVVAVRPTVQIPVVKAPVVAAAACIPTDGWIAEALSPEEQGVVGKWTRPTDGALARSVGEQIRAGFPSSARLELGPDRSDVLLITRTEDLGDNQGSVSGSLQGWPDSTVVLGYADGAVSGTVNLPHEQRSYIISQTEDGTLRVTELDLTQAPQCGEPPPAGGLPLVPPLSATNS